MAASVTAAMQASQQRATNNPLVINLTVNVVDPTETLPMHQLLERFQKQKPESFKGGKTAIEAENWI